MKNNQKEREVAALAVAVSAIMLMLLVIFVLARMACGAEVMRATAAPNGGLAGSKITPDGKSVILVWRDGTVATNAVKLANTPPVARPVIESELRKAVIISAALERNGGSLSLAAEEAQVVLSERRINVGDEPGIVGGGDGKEPGIILEKGGE